MQKSYSKTGVLKPKGIEHELCETYSVYTTSFIPHIALLCRRNDPHFANKETGSQRNYMIFQIQKAKM